MRIKRAYAVNPTVAKSISSVGFAVATLFALPSAHAIELKLDDGWKGSLDTTVSLGTSWRMQGQDPKLYSAGNSSGGATGVSGLPVGIGATNTDSGNLNWNKGDQFSTLLRVTSDLSLSKDKMGAFARVRGWYDYALEDQTVRRGHHGNNWTLNSKLSDSGFDRLQQFSGVALLDAYVYNTFDAGGKPLQLRLGNQVINWGESLFIQGINQINPLDLSTLRKPGAEVKDAFLPITALSANLGLGAGKSLEAFYQFRWTPSNIDSCGTYFGVVETQLTHKAGNACSQILTTLNPASGNAGSAATGQFLNMTNGEKGQDGQFGAAFRFLAESIGTEFGVYATQISSRTPLIAGQTGTNVSQLNSAAIATALLGAQAGYAAPTPLLGNPSLAAVMAGGLTAGFGNYYGDYAGLPAILGLPIAAASTLLNGPLGTAIAGVNGVSLSNPNLPGILATQLRGAIASANGGAPTAALGSWNYASNINIFGVSASTNLGGWSVGGEFSTTNDQPAQINASDILNGIIRNKGPFAPRVSGITTPGTVVNGYDLIRKSQIQVNAVKLFPRVLGSAQAVFAGEVGYQNANVPDSSTGIRYGRAFIFGVATHGAPGAGIDCSTVATNPDGCQNDGFVTKDSWGYRLRYGLEYPNFLNSGMTFFPTFSFAHDVKGYSVDNQFIEDRRVYGASFRFNIKRVHNVELSYIQYGDSAKYDPFRDRDFMSLVFSTSF